MEKFIQMGEKFGLEEEKLLKFVKEQEEKEERLQREKEEKEERLQREKEENEERLRTQQEEKEEKRRQQAEERDEKRRQEEDEKEARRQERELRKMEREAELLRQKEAIEAAKRQNELDLARLAGDGHFPAQPNNNREDRAKTPKYRRALDVYSRLSEEAATDYDKMKLALMKRYDLTEDGYRRKFRVSKPEIDESPDQFIVRLSTHLMRWVELSKTTKSFDGLRDLIVKEQFINSCPKELAIHLRERAPETLEQISQIADQYLLAHGKHVFSSGRSRPPAPPQKDDDAKKPPIQSSQVQCYKCNGRGHKAANCQAVLRPCFLCGRQGHEARNCQVSLKVNLWKAGGSSKSRVPAAPRHQVSAGCLVQSPQLNATPEEVKSCIEEDQLLLTCGKRIPLLSNACVEPLTGARSKMPVVKDRVGEKTVDVLRDTGCSGIVVKELVSEEQYTGEVKAQCLPNAIYDLIVGNVPGARAADDSDPSWQKACAATTRGQAKKAGKHTPLKVPSSSESPIVDREKLMQLQREDESLKKYWNRDDTRVKGQAEISFEQKSGVLYRVYKHPYVNSGKPVRQVLVPAPLRRQIMDVAHGSIMG
ncbi:hypothetical protein ACROYT_G035127 [Oculina patagonica]